MTLYGLLDRHAADADVLRHARRRRLSRAMASAIVIAALGWFYHAGATRHATEVNRIKAQGDQSAYLAEAKLVFANWTGRNQPPIIQPRNRMPLYPAFLAVFYDPAWSDDEFFVHAKSQTVWLSLGLVATLGMVLWVTLPPILATNVILIITFGVYIFKAGYTQSELLYYTFHFLTFVAMWRLLESPTLASSFGHALLVGGLAALAHLTKAAVLPLMAIFLVVYFVSEVLACVRNRNVVRFGWRSAAGLVSAVVFIGLLAPYLANSKKVHGQYFYNLNMSVLVWFDSWPQAGGVIATYGPDGWPKGPKRLRPGPARYWREHTTTAIAARFANGFRDMLVGSYAMFWYLKFVAVYVLLALALMATTWRSFAEIVRRHRALAVFLALYAAFYLPATAFYEPTSGTGTTRFLMAHITPLMFTLSRYFAVTSLRDRPSWNICQVPVTATHMQLFVLGTVALDLTFTVWPRLMSTYGGF